MSIRDEIEDRINQEVFTKTLNKLIEKSGKSYREIARDLNLAESSFFDLRVGSRSYKYLRLKNIADYFSKVLKDNAITLEYLLLGSDETRDSMHSEIERIKSDIEKERAAHAWQTLELKNQLSLFEESND